MIGDSLGEVRLWSLSPTRAGTDIVAIAHERTSELGNSNYTFLGNSELTKYLLEL